MYVTQHTLVRLSTKMLFSRRSEIMYRRCDPKSQASTRDNWWIRRRASRDTGVWLPVASHLLLHVRWRPRDDSDREKIFPAVSAQRSATPCLRVTYGNVDYHYRMKIIDCTLRFPFEITIVIKLEVGKGNFISSGRRRFTVPVSLWLIFLELIFTLHALISPPHLFVPIISVMVTHGNFYSGCPSSHDFSFTDRFSRRFNFSLIHR